MTNKPKILLVEDDESLGFLMTEFLSSNGFHPILCKDGKSGLRQFQEHKFQFVILDVMLPEVDGFTIAKKIKETSPELPVIFVTARAMKEDKIKGFNLGVDDYITKPFDEDELLCRIKAIFNRLQNNSIRTEEIRMIGCYDYEYLNQSLSFGGVGRRLTQRENEVLFLLVQNQDRIVKRDEILDKIWGNKDYFAGRSLDVYISKLRKYFQNDVSVSIENIPKVGFLLSLKK